MIGSKIERRASLVGRRGGEADVDVEVDGLDARYKRASAESRGTIFVSVWTLPAKLYVRWIVTVSSSASSGTVFNADAAAAAVFDTGADVSRACPSDVGIGSCLAGCAVGPDTIDAHSASTSTVAFFVSASGARSSSLKPRVRTISPL